MDRAQRGEKWGHLSTYHVYALSYSHENVKRGSFLYFLLLAAKNLSQFGQNI